MIEDVWEPDDGKDEYFEEVRNGYDPELCSHFEHRGHCAACFLDGVDEDLFLEE